LHKSCRLASVAGVAMLTAATVCVVEAADNQVVWPGQPEKWSFGSVPPSDGGHKVRADLRGRMAHDSGNQVPNTTAGDFGAIFAVPASLERAFEAFAQSPPSPASPSINRTGEPRRSVTMETAIHECCLRASKYSNISRLTSQFAVFRVCMFDHGFDD